MLSIKPHFLKYKHMVYYCTKSFSEKYFCFTEFPWSGIQMLSVISMKLPFSPVVCIHSSLNYGSTYVVIDEEGTRGERVNEEVGDV